MIPEIKALFVNAKLDFSVLGIGIHIENAELVASNEEDALIMMLRVLKKAGKKVLITGLIENIRAINNNKSLTFLYRAKVKELDSLNITAISADYQKVFGSSREVADTLAFCTKGYSLAFQALGYHYWNALCRNDSSEQINLEDVYRTRLIDSGVVDGNQYGFLALKLPRFGHFIDMCSEV